MSPQIIELLIFAAVAFFIINKLISTLGVTADDDPTKQKSYFGEPVAKDVTYTAESARHAHDSRSTAQDIKNLNELIIEQNLTAIVNGMEALKNRMNTFQPIQFMNNAKMAFQMIIEASYKKQHEELEQLVDKRFLEKFEDISTTYGSLLDSTALSAKYSEIYTFGNNAFIKVLFQGKNVVNKIENLCEEWTFTRTITTNNLDWFLSNVEKA